MEMFYAHDGLVGLRDPDWIQGSLNVLIGIFWPYRLVDNISKSKVMKCQLGAIRYVISEEMVGRRLIGISLYTRSEERRVKTDTN